MKKNKLLLLLLLSALIVFIVYRNNILPSSTTSPSGNYLNYGPTQPPPIDLESGRCDVNSCKSVMEANPGDLQIGIHNADVKNACDVDYCKSFNIDVYTDSRLINYAYDQSNKSICFDKAGNDECYVIVVPKPNGVVKFTAPKTSTGLSSSVLVPFSAFANAISKESYDSKTTDEYGSTIYHYICKAKWNNNAFVGPLKFNMDISDKLKPFL